MATPTFVAKKVGDQYVVVPKNPLATQEGSCWFLGGAALLGVGALKRGPAGLVLTLVGGCMLYRAATGTSPLGKLLCRRSRAGGPNAPGQTPSFQNDDRPGAQAPEDAVDEAAMESFPASDPPSHTAATST